MTERNYYFPEHDHTAYSGSIYNYDFDGRTTMGDVIARIISDRRFDDYCRKNSKKKEIMKNGKI
jgi:hypothetical protein